LEWQRNTVGEPSSVQLLDLSKGGVALLIDEEHEVGKSYGLKLVMENGTIVRTLVVVTWTRYVEKQQG
jgi:hypothetical protein